MEIKLNLTVDQAETIAASIENCLNHISGAPGMEGRIPDDLPKTFSQEIYDTLESMIGQIYQNLRKEEYTKETKEVKMTEQDKLRLTPDRVAFMYAKLREYKELEPNMTIDGVAETLEGDVESAQEMSCGDTHDQDTPQSYHAAMDSPIGSDYWKNEDGEWRCG